MGRHEQHNQANDAPSKPNRRNRVGWALWAVSVTALVLAVGVGALPLARAQGWLVNGGSATIAPSVVQQLQPQPSPAGSGVIGQAPVPQTTASAAGQQLSGAAAGVKPTLPGSYGAAAANLNGDQLGYDSNADLPLKPASTMKLMTSAAALETFDASSRFTTRVVATTSGTQASITLVGGGDPMLASAPGSHPYGAAVNLPTTQDLAKAAAAKLKSAGITSGKVFFDDALFAGPSWHPSWLPGDRAWVAPVTALSVDLGNPKGYERYQNPSQAAAKVFADQLTAAGITVDAEPAFAPAPGDAQVLAQVTSAPLDNIIEQMLVHSDNYLAEVLARQIAVATGREPSFDGAAQAETALLQGLGLWSDGQRIVDGSGLSADDRLTAHNLVKVIQLAARAPRQGYILDALPVAASTGTLLNRFSDDQSRPARGIVRAKTGSLEGVSSLAGFTPTADGALVAFAFIGNDMPLDQDQRPWFDHVAAALAGCKCAG